MRVMVAMQQDRWNGLRAEALAALETRDYSQSGLAARVAGPGVGGGELAALAEKPDWWIPGVEIFSRRVFQQRQRGHFGEFAREGEGKLGEIGMWPKQWATALMFARTAKGFHIHPPKIPAGTAPEAWFQRLFVTEPGNYALRPYADEQWDAMFFVRGTCEMFLIDERAGMPRRRMRFVIEGDDRAGADNVGVVIPAGVAHALQSISSTDLVMVYGTSTTFDPANEGRICSGVEAATIPAEWTTCFHAQ